MNFVFRLGVLFAIYGFIWGIIEIAVTILNSGRKKTIFEVYLIKGIKYIFLVDVTFLFCLDIDKQNISLYNLIMAGLILLTYFIGKLQNKQNRLAMFQMMGNGMVKTDKTFNVKAEIGVISIALIVFALFIPYPEIANNPISIWFHESILKIEDTPIFGFIFKVIGFFFLVGMISKMLNAFTFLISGRPFVQTSSGFQTNKKDKEDDSFGFCQTTQWKNRRIRCDTTLPRGRRGRDRRDRKGAGPGKGSLPTS